MSRRAFLGRAIGGVAALGAGSYAWGAGVENRWIEVVRRQHRLPRLPTAWDGVTIAQLSDLHIDQWMTIARVQQIVAQTNALGADIIVLTGDYITQEPKRYVAQVTPALTGLSAPMGVYGVLGNHDQLAPKSVRRALQNAGVIELRNDLRTLQRDSTSLHIAGVNDVQWGQADITKVIDALPRQGCAVLLAHEPDFADTVAYFDRFDLQLSGHSHGGQLRLPLIGPLHTPDGSKKYRDGAYQVGTMKLYVNRGVGTTGLHLRVNCRPEITLHTLRAGAQN